MMDYKKISDETLLAYEKMTRLICSKYEKGLKMYDGTLSRDPYEVNKFEKFNKIYFNITNEMERRILEKCED